jgi:radical SAM superfamily enzyme YgiQ (UPF0313 family)
VAHYDFWDNQIRRSILLDSKADFLVYGMAEKSIVQLAERLSHQDQESVAGLRGICYISKLPAKNSIILPSFTEVKRDCKKFTEMFNLFYEHQNPFSGKTLSQKYENRYLIHNPPSYPLTEKELDAIYELEYEREVHPFYRKNGE